MTGEQFLDSIRYLDSEINALDLARVRLADQRQDILEKAENLGSNLSGVCVQSSVGSKTETLGVELASVPPIESLVKKLNAYQSTINAKIDTLVDRKREAVTAIDRVKPSRCKAVLIYRYIDGLKWATIADLMGYNEHYLRNEIKNQAIAEFEREWKSPT